MQEWGHAHLQHPLFGKWARTPQGTRPVPRERRKFDTNAVCELSVWCFLTLLREGLLWVLQFSPVFKNQHFPIPVRPGIADKELKRKATTPIVSYFLIYSTISLGEPALNKSSIGRPKLTFFCGGISLTFVQKYIKAAIIVFCLYLINITHWIHTIFPFLYSPFSP